MSPEEIQATQYRFSGYQLHKIQLDETGPAYYVVQPHPYYYNQPEYWQKPYYQDPPLASGVPFQVSPNIINSNMSDVNSNVNQEKLFGILPVNKK